MYGEVLQLYAVSKKPYFYFKARENLYQVLQVMCAASERAMKSKVRMINTIVPSYTGKNIIHLLPLALLLVLRTRNNTDGNKLVIFFGIASYYGDYNYISSVCVNKKYIPFLHTYKLLGNSLQKTYMVYTKLRKEDVGIRPTQEEQLL